MSHIPAGESTTKVRVNTKVFPRVKQQYHTAKIIPRVFSTSQNGRNRRGKGPQEYIKILQPSHSLTFGLLRNYILAFCSVKQRFQKWREESKENSIRPTRMKYCWRVSDGGRLKRTLNAYTQGTVTCRGIVSNTRHSPEEER